MVEYHGATPYPVEYKHGPQRKHRPAEVQLGAQALCLEEMTGQAVPKGAIFHTGSHRRQEIKITQKLRDLVERTIRDVRRMLEQECVPPPVNDARCRHCSLKPACMPASVDNQRRQTWWAGQLFSIPDD